MEKPVRQWFVQMAHVGKYLMVGSVTIYHLLKIKTPILGLHVTSSFTKIQN